MKRITSYLCGLLSFLMLFACQKEEFGNNIQSNDEFSLNISTKGLMNQYTVTTRGTDIKTTEEQEIKSLHIFIFDEYGKYLESSTDHRYQGYRSITGGKTVMNIDREGWLDATLAEKATIIVVANVEEGTFTGGTAETHPENIGSRSDLETFIYKPLKERLITQLPESGMPMFGRVENVNLTSSNTEKSIDIPMKALMARVDVSLEINSSNSDLTNTLPSLSVTECKVLNVPLATKFTSDENTETNLDPETGMGKNEFRFPPTTVETIYNKNGKLEYTFYTFENLQEPARTEPEGGYPDGLTEDQKQRYKPELADKENSMVFQLSGKYITYNGAAYDVIYNLYLGSNHTNDFKVGRNKQYKNNVTIKGIVDAGNNPEHVTFDTRVNVSASNPYFVSMLKDRTLDCHFNVVPMDIYFFQENPSSPVTQKMVVEIENPTTANWVRMEKVTAAQMENGEAPNNDCMSTDEPWHAGNGKRKYFTTDLVTNTLSGNTSIEVNTSRDRIYFYVDENLDVWHLGDSRDQRTRTATLKLTYYENNQEVGSRELILEQSKLLEVKYIPDDTGDQEAGLANSSFYIEAYEEYLSHGDPLNEFENNQVYTGLPWEDYEGGSGTIIGRLKLASGPYCSSNFYNGYEFTEKIAQEVEARVESSGGWFPTYTYYYDHLTLNAKPKTAAGYCFIKNKRNADGSVPNPKWFLPGIRQLERILGHYYLEYTEFQNNYYWSSAAGEGSFTSSYENSNNARATKAYIEGGKFKYRTSGKSDTYTGENGTGGFAPRKTILRIRAARIDANPQ